MDGEAAYYRHKKRVFGGPQALQTSRLGNSYLFLQRKLKEALMDELIGRKLGKYTLEARLGEGGMAAVYRSRHPQFDRPVAIKILPATIGQDPSFRARFAREGQMIASLNHPGIIRVYDIDEADGLFYMVMDLLPGGTLEARLREGGLDRKWSADVIVKMAEALDYAHARGVIHRDIKPSNILLDADSQPVLADFGIARMAQPEGESQLTAAGMVMGTPAYMAPEQLSGDPPDARSDIYALGVVLYQLLAGRAPFTGDTMAVVTAHLTKQPQGLRELVGDLPPALDAVALQALAKQPEHRFKSAGVFAQALRSAAADLEPGLVRVASAARQLAAPALGASVPPRAGAVGGQLSAAPPAQPATVGQQVARYLPVALGVLGLLLVGSIVLKYWALVILLALLLGGGGFLFMYLRASSQGRQAARETTRAITTATVRTAAPQPRETLVLEDVTIEPPVDPAAPTQPVEQPPASKQTLVLEDRDDTPELSLPDDPTQAIGAAPTSPFELPPIEDVPLAVDDMPTEALPAAHTDLPPTEAVPLAVDDVPTEALPAAKPELPPTEAVAVATHELPPTEAVALADDLQPTEAVPAPQVPNAESSR
jgi:serine/threonine-protein kinase